MLYYHVLDDETKEIYENECKNSYLKAFGQPNHEFYSTIQTENSRADNKLRTVIVNDEPFVVPQRDLLAQPVELNDEQLQDMCSSILTEMLCTASEVLHQYLDDMKNNRLDGNLVWQGVKGMAAFAKMDVQTFDKEFNYIQELVFKVSHLSTTKDPEAFKNLFKEITGIEYSTSAIQEISNLLQSGEANDSEKYKAAVKNAFGIDFADNTQKSVDSQRQAGDFTGIAIMVIATAGIGELAVMGRIGNAAAGVLGQLGGEIVAGAVSMATYETLMETGNVIGRMEYNNRGINSDDTMSILEHAGTGALTGASAAMIMRFMVNPVVKALDPKATERAFNKVGKLLDTGAPISGMNILETVNKVCPLLYAQAAGFLTETAGFTADSMIKSGLCDLINGKFSLPDTDNAEDLIKAFGEYVAASFGEQVEGLGTIKGFGELLKFIRGGKLVTSGLKQRMKDAKLDKVTVKERTMNDGTKSYVIKNVDGSFFECKDVPQMVATLNAICNQNMVKTSGSNKNGVGVNDGVNEGAESKTIVTKQNQILAQRNGEQRVVASETEDIIEKDEGFISNTLQALKNFVFGSNDELSQIRTELLELKNNNPGQKIADKVKSEWLTQDVNKGVSESEQPLIIAENGKVALDISKLERASEEPVIKHDEVTKLIFQGKLAETLEKKYEAAREYFKNIISNHLEEIKTLAKSNKNDMVNFAQEVLHIIAKELNFTDLEPKIIMNKQMTSSGRASWENGTIELNPKHIENASDVVQIITHELIHILQARDFMAQYGKDGIKMLVNEIPSIEDKEGAINTLLSKEYVQKLLSSVENAKVDENSLDDYLNRVYLQDAKPNIGEYSEGSSTYKQKRTELEAYFAGNNANEGLGEWNEPLTSKKSRNNTGKTTQIHNEGGYVADVKSKPKLKTEVQEYQGAGTISVLTEAGENAGNVKFNVITYPDGKKVLHFEGLESNIEGAGVRTKLISELIKKSYDLGAEGRIEAEVSVSAVRNGKPATNLGFYYEMGFSAVDPKVDAQIRDCIKNGREIPIALNIGVKLEYRNTKPVIDKAVADIQAQFDPKTCAEIVAELEALGFGNANNMVHRTKSYQSLFDKIKNYLIEKPGATIEEAIKEVRDGFGARRIVESGNYASKTSGTMEERINQAIEMQSQGVFEAIKRKIDELANKGVGMGIMRISNYNTADGKYPYLTQRHYEMLKDYAAERGIDFSGNELIDPSDPKAAEATPFMEYEGGITKKQPSGYPALQMNFITKDGKVIEYQFRGDRINIFAEGEHLHYDLFSGKEIIKQNPELEPLYSPIKEIFESMSKEVHKDYLRYWQDYNIHLRKLELGFESTEPKLEDYGNFDPRISAKNLVHCHELGEKVKKGNIKPEEAVKNFNENIYNNSLYLDSRQKTVDILNNTTKIDIIISKNLSKPQLVDITALNLISEIPISNLDPQNITPSALALVHMTRFEPQNGMILSRRDAITDGNAGACRNSVHFTLNHAVEAHHFGNWSDCNYAIIMPYESTVKSNTEGKFIEGLPNDLYTNGSVKIPEDSIIIKFNPEVEKGKFLISDYTDTNGIKVIETSDLPHNVIKIVLEKMGFLYINTNNNSSGMFNVKECTTKTEFIDNLAQNFQSWIDFCKEQGIKPMIHGYSTNGYAEEIIEGIDKLATINSWKCSEMNVDYKSKFIELLTKLEENVSNGDFVSFDIYKLKEIIQSSSYPRTALKRIKSELKITPSVNRSKNVLWMFKSRNKYRDNLHMRFSDSFDTYEKYNNLFSKPEIDINFLIGENSFELKKYKH